MWNASCFVDELSVEHPEKFENFDVTLKGVSFSMALLDAINSDLVANAIANDCWPNFIIIEGLELPGMWFVHVSSSLMTLMPLVCR